MGIVSRQKLVKSLIDIFIFTYKSLCLYVNVNWRCYMPMYVVRRKRLIEGTRKQRELILKSKQKEIKLTKLLIAELFILEENAALRNATFLLMILL